MKKIILLSALIVTILYSGCTSSVPKKVYQPVKNSEVNSYFINGIPIGVLVDDSLIIMAIMNPVEIAAVGYIRLWLLYGNKMSTDFLLAPSEIVTMTISGKDDYESNIKPESSSKILADIEDEKIISSILTTIGGALQTLSTQNTKIYDENNEEQMSIGDKDLKNELILQKTKKQLANTVYYYDLFKESVNQGILKRNTLFPYKSVNGYLYLPIEAYSMYSYRGSFIEDIEDNIDKIIFKINTPIGIKNIEFIPIKGE